MSAADKIWATWESARGVTWDWRERPVFRKQVPPYLFAATEPPARFDEPAPYDVVDFRFETEWHFGIEIAVITGTLDGVSVEVVREPTGRRARAINGGKP